MNKNETFLTPSPLLNLAILCVIAFIPLFLFMLADKLFPLSISSDGKRFAVAVVAEDGTPLRSFPDEKGVWRYSVVPEEVSPLYLKALVNYEDRFFWTHPGFNLASLFRASWQYALSGRPLSGGSTLTMQTARLFHPHSKTIRGKLHQIFRAMQLEFHFGKREILTLYLNHAPFGGPVEGVQAASFAYLGKSAKELSHAEAALLAVLPQAPSRLRPDRHPDRAEKARNKVLDRMRTFGIWDEQTVEEARMERVASRFNPRPMLAPLLARRLRFEIRNPKSEIRNPKSEIRNKSETSQQPAASSQPPATHKQVIRTNIDPLMQRNVAELVRDFVRGMPERTSAAVLVAENQSLKVKAYVGSADFSDTSRFGHVDMVRASRSPGSTLKPFLYAFAMEDGLIHSESLLVDAPFSFKGYRPGNFTKGFAGPVSASEALRRSLNLPAVDLLDRVGPEYFDSRLRQGGLRLRFPSRQSPNLAMILGGAGTSLEELVSAYTALAREGLTGKLRHTSDAPLEERRMMSPGAAYVIRQILREQPRPGLPGGRISLDRSREAAWKTGTSYGFRDAWCVGVSDHHTVGVWVGRPDGTPSPGQYGRATAAPLMFSVADMLPRRHTPPAPVPDTVSRAEICWPLGVRPSGEDDPMCHQRRHAWIMDQVVPPTLPDRADRRGVGNPMSILINPGTGLRVDADCLVPNPTVRSVARWPAAAGPWLTPRERAASRIPRMDPICGKPVSSAAGNIKIAGIESGTVLRPPGSETELPTIVLQAVGGRGRLYWFLNRKLIRQSGVGQPRLYRFERPGRYRLTVTDLAGNHDSVEIVVMGQRQVGR